MLQLGENCTWGPLHVNKVFYLVDISRQLWRFQDSNELFSAAHMWVQGEHRKQAFCSDIVEYPSKTKCPDGITVEVGDDLIDG